ncbi:MAG: hypothetical protein QXM39_04945 [Thermoplasmata archaeon]
MKYANLKFDDWQKNGIVPKFGQFLDGGEKFSIFIGNPVGEIKEMGIFSKSGDIIERTKEWGYFSDTKKYLIQTLRVRNNIKIVLFISQNKKVLFEKTLPLAKIQIKFLFNDSLLLIGLMNKERIIIIESETGKILKDYYLQDFGDPLAYWGFSKIDLFKKKPNLIVISGLHYGTSLTHIYPACILLMDFKKNVIKKFEFPFDVFHKKIPFFIAEQILLLNFKNKLQFNILKLGGEK